MIRLTPAIIFALLAAAAWPLAAGDNPPEPPPGPVKVTKWSMRWDRFKKIGIVDATFKNDSPKRITKVKVEIEFLNDAGKVAKRTSWHTTTLYSFASERMKRTLYNCPLFQRYRLKVTARSKDNEDIEQYFEGRYWPDRPGDNPELPVPIVLAKGSADVRVIASREEYIKRGKRKESLKISGTVQNLGDFPAEKVLVVVKFIKEETVKTRKNKKPATPVRTTVREIRCRIPTSRLDPNQTSFFNLTLKDLPDHNMFDYDVEFDSIGGTKPQEANSPVKPFEMEAGPLYLSHCTIRKNDGMFNGILTNKSQKVLFDVALTIDIETQIKKKTKTITHTIKPGGEILPGEEIPLVQVTTPGYEKFSISIEFQEKE